VEYNYFGLINYVSVLDKIEKTENPDNLYAVVFYQLPVMPEVGIFNLNKIKRPFLLSSVMIMPYTENSLKDIGCEYLPAKFEDE